MIAVISGFFYFDIPQVIRALAKQVSSLPDPLTPLPRTTRSKNGCQADQLWAKKTSSAQNGSNIKVFHFTNTFITLIILI